MRGDETCGCGFGPNKSVVRDVTRPLKAFLHQPTRKGCCTHAAVLCLSLLPFSRGTIVAHGQNKYLYVLNRRVRFKPERQSCRPIARDPITTDIQVGEDGVFGESHPKATGSLVTHSVSGEAQPSQPLRGVGRD